MKMKSAARARATAKLSAIEKFIKENANSIMYIKTNDHYTGIYLKDGTRRSCWVPLKDLEKWLSEKMFFRTHKSYFVNMNFVQNYHKHNSILMAELPNSIEIRVARDRKCNFKKQYRYLLQQRGPGE